MILAKICSIERQMNGQLGLVVEKIFLIQKTHPMAKRIRKLVVDEEFTIEHRKTFLAKLN